MSAQEETIKARPTARPSAPILNRILDAISSVRVGVITLCVLVVLSLAGMLIMQQNVQGFDAYYVSLTPAERLFFGKLGLFDVYHSWYFYFALLYLSLNIILASIDRFPSAWSYIAKPKVKGSRGWLLARRENKVLDLAERTPEESIQRIDEAFRQNGLKTTVTKEQGSTYIFGESGRINRLGAYVVHVFLLTLFLGHFVSLTTGFDADVRMIPGATTDEIQMIEYKLDKKEKFNVKLPFSIECTDIQQRLIDANGPIDVTNTLDWRTQMKISDPQYGVLVADVSMNRPANYRGYRFFQAQTIPVGNARNITLDLTPQTGGDVLKVDLSRNGSTQLADGTLVEFDQFMPDFTFGSDGQPDTRSGDYNNPVAVLNVTPPQSERIRVFAFAQKLPDNAPVGAPKAGYKWRLADYEKSPLAHVLSIKYDPYNAAFIAWYIGGFGLVGALMFVFFISHKRVWAEVTETEDGKTEVVLAGEANRNQNGFEDKFKKIVSSISGK
ncbi:MAG: cytochrome c biogenesis protein ResB [Pyrinomonadaceae bacterium]